MASISIQRRDQIIDALRRGTVPQSSLDAFAVGLDRFEAAIDDELRKVSAGGSVFKAVRGEYGWENVLCTLAGRSRPQDGICFH